MALSDIYMDRIAFQQWSMSENGDNAKDIAHLRNAVATGLKECVSETQRTYIMHYFFDSLTISQIANMYGRNKSSVSRGIKTGLKNLFEHLRFASPHLLNACEFSMQKRLKRG